MLDFPNAPVLDQLFQAPDSATVWRWDSEKWVGVGGGAPGSGTVVGVSAGTGVKVTPNPIAITGTVALADMPALTLKGNAAGVPAAPADLSPAAAVTVLGGPFLKMTGGTLSGALLIDQGVEQDCALRPNALATDFGAAYQAFLLSGNYTGSGLGPYAELSIADTAANTQGGTFLCGLRVDHNMNAGLGAGSRTAFQAILNKIAATPGTNGQLKYYTAIFGQVYADADDGGALPLIPMGDLYALAGLCQLEAGATYYNSAQGAEIDIAVRAGASVRHKSCLTLYSANSDAVHGDVTDAMLVFGRDNTTTVGFRHGIQFGRSGEYFPIDPTGGTLIGVVPDAYGSYASALYGVDLRNLSITSGGYAFISDGFQVDGVGGVTLSGASGGLNLLAGNIYFGGILFGQRTADDNIVYDVTGTVPALLLGASQSFLRNDMIVFQTRTGSQNTLQCNASALSIVGVDAIKPGGGSWVAPSDSRLKTAVAPYRTGLAAVTRLQPVTYEYTGEAGLPTGETFHGLNADDLPDKLPEALRQVHLGRDAAEYQGVDMTPLTLALVNCVKELAARVSTLEEAAI